jgi:amino acid permease
MNKDNILNEEDKMRIEHILSTQSMLMTNNPDAIIASKLESSHVKQLLESKDKQNEREYKMKRDMRLLAIVITVIILAFILLFCIAFKDDTDTIKTVLVPLVTLIFGGSAGGLGGYGLGYKKGISSDE